MNNKFVWAALLLFFCRPTFSADPATISTGAAPPADHLLATYVGADTRVGLGYDSKTKLRGEAYHVLSEDKASAWIGEGWVSDRAGGLQLNYHWLPDGALKKPDSVLVRKLFAAIDQNQQHDRKVTLGAGVESEPWFFNGYVSRAITGQRNLYDTTTSTTDTVNGVDNGRPFVQDVTTSTHTQVFERAYDYGTGVRGGHFFEQPLLRLTLGADYEWGTSSARQTTVSLNVEKFFGDTPHSIALYGEAYRKSGDFETQTNDRRVSITYRYEFGGKPYQSLQDPRRAAGTAAAKAQPADQPVAPRTGRRMVKTTASIATDTFFDFDRASVRLDAKPGLDQVVATLKRSSIEGNIHVTGHTCDIGGADYNQKLSERRAGTIMKYLIAAGAANTDRVLAEGMGKRNPRYPNNKEGRPKNRRVDIEFITFASKEEEFPLPPPTVATTGPAPAVEWRQEVIDREPAWLHRALHNTAQHKQTVDVYRGQEQTTTITQGERRFGNHPPVAQNDAFTVATNSTNNSFDVLANDSDPDGDALTITSVTFPGHGSATVAGNRVSYTPTPGYVGADSLIYSITDGKGGNAVATVSIAVGAAGQVTRPPVANDDMIYVFFNTPATADVLLNDSSPDGYALTIVNFTQPAHGAVQRGPNNRLVYTPATGFMGFDTFNYSIADGHGGTASAKVIAYVDP